MLLVRIPCAGIEEKANHGTHIYRNLLREPNRASTEHIGSALAAALLAFRIAWDWYGSLVDGCDETLYPKTLTLCYTRSRHDGLLLWLR